MKKLILTLTLGTVLLTMGSKGGQDRLVLLPVAEDPTVSFRIVFQTGSQDDPTGKEGLAAVTAALVAEGATRKHSYEEVLSLLYPMAADVSEQVDKEMTVFSGRTHKDNLESFYRLLKEIVLEPAFADDDFVRVKSDFLNYVRTTLRYSQDEELGKEALYEFIFAGTPYEHNEEGYVKRLESMTVEDVRAFYAKYYTRENVVIGLGGGFEKAFAERVRKDFEALPKGSAGSVPKTVPAKIGGIQARIIEKDVQSTAISFGFPIDVTRGSRDYYALAIATSWLGQHRTSFAHLYQVIREARGLNYGDYAYIEHFPMSHGANFPPPNVARRQQIFQVWIRPVPNETRLFAFRAALRELQGLVENGMTAEEFEHTRKFLKGYTLHYAPTTTAKLGYAIDDRFYGIEKGHWATFSRMLDELTVKDVNAALKRHFTYENLKVIFVTPDAEGLKNALVTNAPSPITYASEKPAAVMEEDKEISAYPVAVKPENVTIVKADDVFEGD